MALHPHLPRSDRSGRIAWGVTAFFLSACATTPPAPRADLTPAQRITEASTTIAREYITSVDLQHLADDCGAALAARPQRADPSSTPTSLTFTEIAARVEATPQEQGHALADSCIRGMVEGLGDLSVFFDKDEFRELTTGSQSAAVGLELRRTESGAPIVDIREGTPAALAGLARGDVIVAIDGVDVRALPLSETVRRLRGESGSTVTLTIPLGSRDLFLDFAGDTRRA